MARFKIVSIFLLTILAGIIFWGFALRALAAALPNSRIVQGLVAVGAV